jgi:hypothetical protein
MMRGKGRNKGPYFMVARKQTEGKERAGIPLTPHDFTSFHKAPLPKDATGWRPSL